MKLVTERLPIKNITIDRKSLSSFYKAKRLRYESMINYIVNEECRAQQLLAYFGEISKEDCGICDFCKGVFTTRFSQKEYEAGRHLILSSLSRKPMSVDDVLELWPLNKRNKLKSIVEKLAEQSEILFEGNKMVISGN